MITLGKFESKKKNQIFYLRVQFHLEARRAWKCNQSLNTFNRNWFMRLRGKKPWPSGIGSQVTTLWLVAVGVKILQTLQFVALKPNNMWWSPAPSSLWITDTKCSAFTTFSVGQKYSTMTPRLTLNWKPAEGKPIKQCWKAAVYLPDG